MNLFWDFVLWHEWVTVVVLSSRKLNPGFIWVLLKLQACKLEVW